MAELDAVDDTLLTLTADIVAAHVSNNNVDVSDIPTLITNVYQALNGLGSTSVEEVRPEPALLERDDARPAGLLGPTRDEVAQLRAERVALR